MNFINKGDKHAFFDFSDEYPSYEETSRERYIPSYYNAVMRNGTAKVKTNGKKMR